MREAFQFDIRPVRLRDMAFVTLVGTVLGFAFMAVFLIAWAFSFSAGHAPSPDVVKLAVRTFSTSFDANMTLIVLFYVPGLWVMWRVARRFSTQPLQRFFPRIDQQTALVAAAAGVFIALLSLGLEDALTRMFGVSFEATAAEKALMPYTPTQLVIGLAAIAVIAPFAEEFFFRGYLLAWLRNAIGAPMAVVLSALAFALVHGYYLLHPGVQGWVNTSEIFVAGLVMGFAVLRTGSVWTSFAIHAAYNATVVFFAFLSPS